MTTTARKIEILGEAARYDVCLSSCFGGRSHDPADPLHRWIYPASLPGGRTAPILKILMENACSRSCAYCANRMGGSSRPVSFKPDELARLFMELVRRHRVHGLFLSSAIPIDANRTMQEMIETAEILRCRYRFRGYIHLKILPGVRYDLVERAVELATRVSINLEAPTEMHLARIAGDKDFESDLVERMRWAGKLIRSGRGARSQTTQFIVGSSDETDREIIGAANRLYGEVGLFRAYYSAFQPVPGTPMEGEPPVELNREHRLYQADYLLRFYGFAFEEIAFEGDGSLSRDVDPKMRWAIASPDRFPVEVNTADYKALLRVPGIGPKSATRIVRERRKGKFHRLDELRRTGAIVDRAAPFLHVDGRIEKRPVQMELSF